MKSKIKKIIIFIYCIVIAFSLTSCDNKTPGLQSQPWSSEGVSETSSVEKVSSEKEDPSGKGNLWADKRPVSYTHLDVYKRQIEYCAKKVGYMTNNLSH